MGGRELVALLYIDCSSVVFMLLFVLILIFLLLDAVAWSVICDTWISWLYPVFFLLYKAR